MSKLPEFARKLRTLRATSHLTQQKAAAALSITHSAYASYEEGRAEPKMRTLVRLADLFGCTLDELLRPAVPVEPSPQAARKRPARPAMPVSARPFLTWDHHS
ncbi:helix-turn-helix domain-containing protein [Hymenobacter sediminicola]|uniref:Helix-turn-helix transcriptional regulator n=1 Tax=Hymenobacter sediminicola TaxID=2761579 RepID=A0A7G7W2X5_9BACT|nr:helix-turn-helix transcriptional regulator [Hymenobacter sediminicola]QNH60718.1 helix-turn-helix transcriptional regulator [Hymenobacter sediminicola]